MINFENECRSQEMNSEGSFAEPSRRGLFLIIRFCLFYFYFIAILLWVCEHRCLLGRCVGGSGGGAEQGGHPGELLSYRDFSCISAMHAAFTSMGLYSAQTWMEVSGKGYRFLPGFSCTGGATGAGYPSIASQHIHIWAKLGLEREKCCVWLTEPFETCKFRCLFKDCLFFFFLNSLYLKCIFRGVAVLIGFCSNNDITICCCFVLLFFFFPG